MMLTDLADAARKSGLTVIERPGWKTRGNGSSGMRGVKTIVCHHTAGPKSGDYPSLNYIETRKLSQIVLGRSGTVVIVAAGLCYHAGVVLRTEYSNSWSIGIEAEATGVDTWPKVQYDAYVRLCAALAKHYNVPLANVLGHKEVASPKGRKVDPNFDMYAFRSAVRSMLTTASPPITDPEPELPPSGLRKGNNVLENFPVRGTGTLRLNISVGPRSVALEDAWIITSVNGPAAGTARLWFQDDSAGVDDAVHTMGFSNGRSERKVTQVPQGTTMVNVQYEMPDGGTITVEGLSK